MSCPTLTIDQCDLIVELAIGLKTDAVRLVMLITKLAELCVSVPMTNGECTALSRSRVFTHRVHSVNAAAMNALIERCFAMVNSRVVSVISV